MSTPRNNIVREVARKSIFEEAQPLVPTSLDYNQGDLLYCISNAIAKGVNEGSGATFLGVAVQTVVDGIPQSPYSNVPVVNRQMALPGPAYGVIASLYLKEGDALAPGDYVYANPETGDQHVQDSGTKPIGTYQGAAITGGSSTLIEVLVGARFPNDTLKF